MKLSVIGSVGLLCLQVACGSGDSATKTSAQPATQSASAKAKGSSAPSSSAPASAAAPAATAPASASAATSAAAPEGAGGLESSEAVARAFIKALNEGSLESGLALFPSDAVLASAVTCTGPGLAEEMIKFRANFTKLHGDMAKARKDGHPIELTYVGPGTEAQNHKKGDVEDGCTWQLDVEVRPEIINAVDAKQNVAVMNINGRYYLVTTDMT